MMDMEIWAAFVVAATIVLVMPGPTIIFVISQAVVGGRHAVALLVLGVFLGDLTAMTLSLLGLGTILMTSAALFTLLKWIGAGYLVYLGIKHWRRKSSPMRKDESLVCHAGLSLPLRAFVITALNPKSIVFFIAFLPQFIQPAGDVHVQLLLLGSTFLVLAVVNCTLYGFLAGYVRHRLERSFSIGWFNRAAASALIGAGLLTLAAKRSG